MEPELERSKQPRRVVIPPTKEQERRTRQEPTPAPIQYERRTYAREVCVVLGVILLSIGFVGFVVDNLLDAHLSYAHNLIHVVSGALAVWFGVNSENAAKRFSYIFGAVYGLLGVLGFVVGVPGMATVGHLAEDRFLWRISPEKLELGTVDHTIHLVLGAAFLLGGLILFKRKKREPL